jgi:S-adenosylmethionine synthetase
VADQISDAVLDHLVAADPIPGGLRDALSPPGSSLVAGEISTEAGIKIPEIVRETLLEIGYDDAAYGIDGRTCGVLTTLDRQSGDIAMGVDAGGAGDQGMMFGYATDETEVLMPVPVVLAHRLTRGLARGSGGAGRSPGSGPTARPRSRWPTTGTSRSRSRRWW